MSNYENDVMKQIFKIKSNVEQSGFVTSETYNDLLSLYVSEKMYSQKLYKELEYALSTGGEYKKYECILH